jgi:hypothetical protein
MLLRSYMNLVVVAYVFIERQTPKLFHTAGRKNMKGPKPAILLHALVFVFQLPFTQVVQRGGQKQLLYARRRCW